MQDSWLCFLLIYSTSIDTRSGSFSEMHGKLNKCKSGFHVDLHQAWTMSRIQSSINERTILYLTADNLAQSSLPNFCLMQNVKNVPFPICAHLIKWLVQEHCLLSVIPITNIQVLRLYQSCWNIFVQYYFRTLPKSHLFFFLLERERSGWLQHGEEQQTNLHHHSLSNFINISMTRHRIIDTFKKWHFPPDNPNLKQDILVSQLPDRNSIWIK